MKTKTKEDERVRLNLTLEKEFYQLIKERAEENYLKVTAFIVQHLKKTLLSQPIISVTTDSDSDHSDDNIISRIFS